MSCSTRGDKVKHRRLDEVAWFYKDGVLWAQEVVNKKYFGNFDIYFKQNPSRGTVVAWIENKDYPMLNRTEIAYESFEKALDGIYAYFEGIAEKQRNIPPEAEYRAKMAYQKVIADEIAKMVVKG